MHTSTPLLSPTGCQILVDWSALLPSNATIPAEGSDEGQVLEWVRTNPNRANLHIYLQRTLPAVAARRLQNSLQALGCKVTTRYTTVAVSETLRRA